MSLVSVPRFERALERFGERMLERIFRPDEIAYARRKRHGAESLAARFAAKCAGRSLLRSRGGSGLCLRDFEVERKASGEPTLRVHRSPSDERATPPLRFSLSLAHDADFALAVLTGYRRAKPACRHGA